MSTANTAGESGSRRIATGANPSPAAQSAARWSPGRLLNAILNRGRWPVAVAAALGALLCAAPATAREALPQPQSQEIETYLYAYPKRAFAEMAVIVARSDAPSASERAYRYALYGQSMVAAGRTGEALDLAEHVEREAAARRDPLALVTARLLRANIETVGGDMARGNALAKEARALLPDASDPYLGYWAAITIGITARGRGQLDESLASLQDALLLAEAVGNAHRRSSAYYQLAHLYLALKQPQAALEASQESFRFAEAASNALGMAKARMAESAALELLDDPVRELAAMEDALAIARSARSKVGESLALINLADIRLRRRQFSEALELSRRSFTLAREFGDTMKIATSKANMGFALFGLGRPGEGKRLADEALADYERTGATAEIAVLLGEYSHYLERSGDYRTALALAHRERKLNDQIAAAAHHKTVVEMQEKYESEKKRREIELLNRQNELASAELENRTLQQRVWWLLAAVFAASFAVVAVLYHKLRVTNGLLASTNHDLSLRSSRDPLTALYNRRYFQDFMRDESSRPERRRNGDTERAIHALLLIDIDLFKQINDRYGHVAGDAVLVTVARRLREALRETDMIVRWGGEEFLVFVPATSADKLDEIATRIMHALACEPVVHQGAAIPVTASIGYAPMPLPPDDVALPWERAISLVDMALYMAKVHGRNRAYGIRGLRDGGGESLAAIEHDLEKAWESGIVDMHLQPGPEPGTRTLVDATRAISHAAA